ncbi:MAG: ribosome silencing factor [Clostridia bacterium]
MEDLTKNICHILDERQANNIVVVDLRSLTTFADEFIICSGRSTSQVKALANYVDQGMSELGVEPVRMEGKTEGRWVVVDYGDVIVHIFHDETRQLYSLEQLWSQGANVEHYSED